MSETKFTPGPWTPTLVMNALGWVRAPNGQRVAIACGQSNDHTVANARLIAAAPDLYEALAPFASAYPGEQSPVSLDEPVVCEFTMRQLKAAAAAIAKAEGRT